MSEKPCFYAVLGVAKTASPDDIKKAHKKIAMTCHPDITDAKVKAGKMTQKEADAALVKLQAAEEAWQVLKDTALRTTYDKFGHQGLDRLKAQGNTADSGASKGSTISFDRPAVLKRPLAEDAFSYFGSISDDEPETTTEEPDTTVTPSSPSDRLKAYRERKAAEEAAKKNPQAVKPTPPVAKPVVTKPTQPVVKQPTTPTTKPVVKPTPSETFTKVADEVSQANSRLKMAQVPLEQLEEFRENLKDLMETVDKAIVIARRDKKGPGFA